MTNKRKKTIMKPEQNFEKAIHDLEDIVHQLEKGDLPLDETLKQFEQGMKLSQFCQQALQDAQKKIEQLKIDQTTRENNDHKE